MNAFSAFSYPQSVGSVIICLDEHGVPPSCVGVFRQEHFNTLGDHVHFFLLGLKHAEICILKNSSKTGIIKLEEWVSK